MSRFLTGGVLLIAFIFASSISTATCNPTKVFANMVENMQQRLVSTSKFNIWWFVNLQVGAFIQIKGFVGHKSQRTGSEKCGTGDKSQRTGMESETIGRKSLATGDATKSNFDCSEKYPPKLSRNVRCGQVTNVRLLLDRSGRKRRRWRSHQRLLRKDNR